ncbi:MAG: ribulokinase [Treponema sp.]|jgi:L-ribulokinase|nr:ribulokinase [Treponema sp.]
MELQKGENRVLGLDFGTDSCRAVILDAASGEETASAHAEYTRWAKGLYCSKTESRFRQHPLDYIEALESCVREAVKKAGAAEKIRGIGIDATGSTPCAVDREGGPLALKDEFAENPSAMFVLWKDHTSAPESEKINRIAKEWKGVNYLLYNGGVHSPEWFWSKVMRVLSEDAEVEEAAFSFLEHCEWLPFLLTGGRDARAVKRCRCSMGLRALWHPEFGGYPPVEFFEAIDPRLPRILETMGNETWPADTAAGLLSGEWAERLRLPAGIPVTVGAIDAHVGGTGGGVRPGWMVMVAGTSTCDLLVAPKTDGPQKAIRGICGQVEGAVVPGMTGYEAGQSAFGDVYAWFRDLLLWPLEEALPRIYQDLPGLDPSTGEKLRSALRGRVIPALEAAAERIDPVSSGITALDWLNGRRTPDADLLAKGAVVGLTLGSDAPRVYRALADATAFGLRAIVERFREEGIPVDGIFAVGGVARKSSLVMQIAADVLDMPIHVRSGDESVARGSAMFAAVGAGLYPDIPSAQEKLCSPVEKIYRPRSGMVLAYNRLYGQYKELGENYGRNS